MLVKKYLKRRKDRIQTKDVVAAQSNRESDQSIERTDNPDIESVLDGFDLCIVLSWTSQYFVTAIVSGSKIPKTSINCPVSFVNMA